MLDSLKLLELFYIILTISHAQKRNTELAGFPNAPQKFHGTVKTWAKYLAPQSLLLNSAIVPVTQAETWKERWC